MGCFPIGFQSMGPVPERLFLAAPGILLDVHRATGITRCKYLALDLQIEIGCALQQ